MFYVGLSICSIGNPSKLQPLNRSNITSVLCKVNKLSFLTRGFRHALTGVLTVSLCAHNFLRMSEFSLLDHILITFSLSTDINMNCKVVFLFFYYIFIYKPHINHISKHSYMYTNYSLLQTIQIISGDLKTNHYDYRPWVPANTRPRTSADQCWRIVSDSGPPTLNQPRPRTARLPAYLLITHNYKNSLITNIQTNISI